MHIPEEFEDCRLYGHAWTTTGIDLSKRNHIGEELTCDRCATVKISALKRRTGIIVKSRYLYPTGYLQDRKFTRKDRGKLRVEKLTSHANSKVTHIHQKRRA